MHSWCAIATLMAFLTCNVFAICPLSVPLPHRMPPIPLNLATVLILAVALRYTAQCLDIVIVRNRIIGMQGAKLFGVLSTALVLCLVASIVRTDIWKICMPIIVTKLIVDFSWDRYYHARSKHPSDNPIHPRGSAIMM